MEASSSPQAQSINLTSLIPLLKPMKYPSLHRRHRGKHYQKLKVNHPKIILLQLELQENPQLVSLHLLHIVIHTAR